MFCSLSKQINTIKATRQREREVSKNTVGVLGGGFVAAERLLFISDRVRGNDERYMLLYPAVCTLLYLLLTGFYSNSRQSPAVARSFRRVYSPFFAATKG